MDLHVRHDARHVLAQDPDRPDRYHVATHDGDAIGTVYRTARGYRCWTLRDPGEPTVVRNLARALAHYRR